MYDSRKSRQKFHPHSGKNNSHVCVDERESGLVDAKGSGIGIAVQEQHEKVVEQLSDNHANGNQGSQTDERSGKLPHLSPGNGDASAFSAAYQGGDAVGDAVSGENPDD